MRSSNILRVLNWKFLSIFAFLPLITYSFIAINVSKNLTEDDKEVIKELSADNECENLNSFESEIQCIKKIQQVQSFIGVNDLCRRGYINVEPKEFLNANFGCCFDRARLIEKMLTYYGLKNRRIAFYKLEQGNYSSLLTPLINSHAAVEAKTKKGWIGIETNFYKTDNKNFLLIDENNNPYTFKYALNYKKSLFTTFGVKVNEIYQNRNLITIVGLYSRHGRFHYPYLPFPEVNLVDFLTNFTNLN